MAKQRKRNPRYRLKFVFSGARALICLVLLAALAGVYYYVLHWSPLKPTDSGTQTENVDGLVWHTVNVGQGDCTIVQFPDDKVLMVDAGSENNDRSSATIFKYLETWQITTIDWFVITHPDEDHFGGATKLLANDDLTFDQLYCTAAFEKDLASYINLMTKYPNFHAPDDGEVIAGADYKITFVSPFSTDKAKDSNDASLMMTIEYYNKIFVLTGDASSAMDDEFINHATKMGIFDDNLDKQIILKVAHHGSRTGSSDTFLSFIFSDVIPDNTFALISCGKDNSYKHPHQEALNRLSKYVSDEHLLVTMDVGDIVIQATENALTINDTEVPSVNVMVYVFQSGMCFAVVVVIVCCFCRFEINTKTVRRK